MNRLALGLGVLTVVLLDVILAFGNGSARAPVFYGAIELLPACMIPSSALFAYLFFRTGHRRLAALFLLNIGAFLIVVGILVAGGQVSERVLFVADVLQLNLYLVALVRHWSVLSQPTASKTPIAVGA